MEEVKTFDDWFEAFMVDALGKGLSIKDTAKAGWEAARDNAALIAWEHARDIRKARHTGTRCDEIAEDISLI